MNGIDSIHREKWLEGQAAALPLCCTVYIRLLYGERRVFMHDCHSMASASLIKVPIMVEAFRQKKARCLDFQEMVRIHGAVEGGSFYRLSAGTTVTIETLVRHMIVESDNTCTNMLIDVLGMDQINSGICRMGMTKTVLQRKMMDFSAAAAGRENRTDVEDMGLLFEHLYEGHCIDQAQDAAMREILSWQEDNCLIPAQLPHPVRVDHKTGELNGMYHDCGIVYAPSGPFVLCLMAEQIQDEARAVYGMSYFARSIYDKIEMGI